MRYDSTFRWITGLFLPALVSLVSTPLAEAITIRVSQESAPAAGDFDDHVLGFIEAFETSDTASAFYHYGAPHSSSYNGESAGGPVPVAEHTQVFLVQASDGLSLFVVHDAAPNADGGRATMAWDLEGDTAGSLFVDDPTSTFDRVVDVDSDGTSFATQNGWFDCCTDGFVIGVLEGAWSLFGEFTVVNDRETEGLTGWLAVSNDGATVPLIFEVGRRVRLDLVLAVPVDIKPGSCPNPLNVRKRGVVPVAILGTEDFDVTLVDPTSVELEGVSPLRWALEDVARPFEPSTGKDDCFEDCTEAGRDGVPDLTLKFDAPELVAALGDDLEDGQCLTVRLSGSLRDEFGGDLIAGEDVVLILKNGRWPLPW